MVLSLRNFFCIVLMAFLVNGHGFVNTAKAQGSNADLEGFAQWNLNYGAFLVDEGKYLEALEAYDSAFDSSGLEKTRVRALLQRAMVFATYLNDVNEAIATYQVIERDYPQQAQTALYRRGLLLFDSSRLKQAVQILEHYQKRYPTGNFIFQVEVLLDQAKKAFAEIIEKPVPPAVAPVLRVLISKNGRSKTVSKARLEAAGMSASIDGKQICVGDAFDVSAERSQVRIVSRTNGARVLQGKVIVSAARLIRVSMGSKVKTVRGKVGLEAAGDTLRVLNLVDMESYLRSVVPAESIASWPLETLKSQAVAARTYAYNRKLGRTKWVYDVTDDTWDQVYGGVEKENKKTDRAVSESSGMVLVMKEGRDLLPIQTYFTANSGGYTSDPKAIFNLSNTPYLRAQPDRESLKGKMASWTRKMARSEIETILKRRKISVGRLEAIEPAEKGPSGRLLRVRLRGSDRTVEVKSKPLLTGGGLKLPEVLVRIEKEGNTFVFYGHGFGHGLGYSQWGGAIMGRAGKSYEDILAFYYKGAALRKLW